jgi:hypothetical protein
VLGRPVPGFPGRGAALRMDDMKSMRSLFVRILAAKFLSSAYLQLLAACLLASATVPAAAWGPIAVDRARDVPGPAERTAFVQHRHTLPAPPPGVPDAPCILSGNPPPIQHPNTAASLTRDVPLFLSFASSLLADRAPPAAL